ncbi:MAG: hypothetical protein IJK62_08955, partial [Bacteroidales bacterium]|nr:hypothetical protein [Bacteroidales bacterium]
CTTTAIATMGSLCVLSACLGTNHCQAREAGLAEVVARRAVGRGAHPSALPNHARQASCHHFRKKI